MVRERERKGKETGKRGRVNKDKRDDMGEGKR
jgi:hypothetical protein